MRFFRLGRRAFGPYPPDTRPTHLLIVHFLLEKKTASATSSAGHVDMLPTFYALRTWPLVFCLKIPATT